MSPTPREAPSHPAASAQRVGGLRAPGSLGARQGAATAASLPSGSGGRVGRAIWGVQPSPQAEPVVGGLAGVGKLPRKLVKSRVNRAGRVLSCLRNFMSAG